MGTIHKKANLILILVDGYTNSTSLKGVVNIRTENGIYARDKGDGCYVFVDCYPGKYTIYVNPSVYEKQTFDICIDDSVQVKYLFLQPGSNYPLLKHAIRVWGQCRETTLYAALEGDEAGSTLEKCQAGTKKIHLYFPERKGVLGRKFYFTNGEQYGVRTIIREEPDCNAYEFDEALEFDVMPYTQILPVYEAYIDNGIYFLVVRRTYRRIHLLGQAGKKTLEIQPDIQEYQYDYTED
jgi:hypothetical protein